MLEKRNLINKILNIDKFSLIGLKNSNKKITNQSLKTPQKDSYLKQTLKKFNLIKNHPNKQK